MNPFMVPGDGRELTDDEARLLSRAIQAANSVEQRSGVRPTRVLVAVDLWPDSVTWTSSQVGDLLVERSALVQPGSVVCIRDLDE